MRSRQTPWPPAKWVMALRTVLGAADLHHPAVDAAMAAAVGLLGMQAVYVGGLSDDEFVFERLWGDWDGISEGQTLGRTDSMCHRLLAGAPPATSDTAAEAAYADAPAQKLGIVSYVGVPLQPTPEGASATFCGIDRRSVTVAEQTLAVFRALAKVIEAHVQPYLEPVVRRTAAGWQVAGREDEELLSAMVLADLLVPSQPTGPRSLPPPAPPAGAEEVEQLRVTVRQLEHALASRVVVEQAIGVLAERQQLLPRTAFERLRRAARSRGRRVVDLAREVVASSSDLAVPLPPELAGRRT